MHIRISLSTKFQLKLTILFFFDQICPKSVFLVEDRKITLLRASFVITYYINASSPSSRRDKNNTCVFDNEYFLQLQCTTMGTVFAPTYANLSMGYNEIKPYHLIELN